MLWSIDYAQCLHDVHGTVDKQEHWEGEGEHHLRLDADLDFRPLRLESEELSEEEPDLAEPEHNIIGKQLPGESDPFRNRPKASCQKVLRDRMSESN